MYFKFYYFGCITLLDFVTVRCIIGVQTIQKKKREQTTRRPAKKIFDRIKKADCVLDTVWRASVSPLHDGHGNHIVTAGNVSPREVWRIAETRLGSSPVLNYVVRRVLASYAYVV